MRHITQNSARNRFWTCLQNSGKQLVNELLRTLSSVFAALYKSWDKGKGKYMKFQLEWHQYCSVFLLPRDKELSDIGVDAKKNVDLVCSQQRWVGYCEGLSVSKQDRDAVMISVCGAVYNFFLKRVSKVQQSTLEPTS